MTKSVKYYYGVK